MKKIFLFASLLIVVSAIKTGAAAQNIYKCSANTYSQIPCPDGVQLTPADAPDRARQKQADRATARDTRTADRMEKARLRQEQLDLKANTPTAAKAGAAVAVRTRKAVKTKDFVAEIPSTEKTTKRKPKAD